MIYSKCSFSLKSQSADLCNSRHMKNGFHGVTVAQEAEQVKRLVVWCTLRAKARHYTPIVRDRVSVCVSDLDHGGDGMDTAQILDNALGEVSHTQADGPVGVSLQPDHLVGTKIKNTIISVCLQSDIKCVTETSISLPRHTDRKAFIMGKKLQYCKSFWATYIKP